MTKLIKKAQKGISLKNNNDNFFSKSYISPFKSIKSYDDEYELIVEHPFSENRNTDNPKQLSNFKAILTLKGLGPNLKQENLNLFYNILNARTDLNKYQKAAIAANVAHESYFNPTQKQIGGPAFGILQYEGDRQKEYKQFINNPKYKNNLMKASIDYLYSTMIGNPDTQKHWNAGRKYNRAREAYDSFKNAKDLRTAMDSSFYGYVRPKDDSSYAKRYKLAKEFLEIFT